MQAQQLRILLANTLDQEGGAEQVAWSLLQGYRNRGHAAWLAVGVKKSRDHHVLMIDNTKTRNPWARFWWRAQRRATMKHGRYSRWGEKLRRGLALVADPTAAWATLQGHENSRFPGTYALLDLPPQRPNILHCHSLQRGYFDLEALPWLSRQVPTVLTLHDAWLLSGHCTHPFSCDRWRTGCGHCPDLTIPPALLRDGSAHNWQRKQAIFQRSRLWVAADSQWLMDKVNASMLGYVDARVIYPGVQLETFVPGDQLQARAELGLPLDAHILLFVAHKARTNPWKDYPLLEKVITRVRECMGDNVILLIAGDPSAEKLGEERGEKIRRDDPVWFAPHIPTSSAMACYYRAADLYVHATHVETFGLTLVEAMSTGLPVIATRTAAIPEVVPHGEAGFLTTPHEVEEMAEHIIELLRNPSQRKALGLRATQVAQRFNVERTITMYLDWYAEILDQEARRS